MSINKKQVRRNIKQLQRIKTWQLVVLLILSVFVSATFLRLNNIGMIERRKAVLSADETGNNDTTKNRLFDLQRYVSAHMNTSMGKGLYLESSYKRTVKTAYDQASKDTNPNGNVYKKAQDVCAPKFSNWSYAYIQCTTTELAKYPSSEELISSVKLPQADSFLYSYQSPAWSPDFAGWSIVFCVVILIMIITRFISVSILKMILHFKNKGI